MFTGTSDGYVKGFHSETGEQLWEFNTGSGVISQPITWEMEGKQYLGIASGYGGAVPLWGGDMATLTTQVSQGGSFLGVRGARRTSRERTIKNTMKGGMKPPFNLCKETENVEG